MPRVPFQVQSVLKQGVLMVLIQHPPDVEVEPQQVFGALEAAIQALPASFFVPIVGSAMPHFQVKLYVRVQEQAHSYAFSRFKYAPLLVSDKSMTPPRDRTAVAQMEQESQVSPSETGSLPTTQPIGLRVGLEDELLSEPSREPSSGPFTEPFDLPIDRSPEPVGDRSDATVGEGHPEAINADSIAADSEDASEDDSNEATRPVRSRVIWMVAGVAVSVISFSAGLLLMSRPCLLGRCETFQAAKELGQQSQHTLKTATSWQDVRAARQQLTDSNRLLASIPPWSNQHGEAVELLQTQQPEATLLEQLLPLERKADEAIQKSQVLPQPVDGWIQIQTLWRSAIAQLEAIPAASPLSRFAQERLRAYRSNLETIDTYLKAEQQAQKQLKAAKTAARLADARQSRAQSLAAWQQTQVTWQTAVNLLQQISPGTTSHAAAQKLLTSYQSELMGARDRVTREQMAAKSYTQALSLAQTAKQFEQQNQWSRAVVTWRDALTQAKQVPEDSLHYKEAQLLLAPYANALQVAESRLQGVVEQQKAQSAQQQVRRDLDRLCAGTPKTCTYRLFPDLIRIQFTAAYEQALSTAFTAGRTGNYGALGGAVNHVESLQSALQAIATNANTPVKVYNSANTELMGSFNPGGQ